MKKRFKIGKAKENEIVIQDDNCPNLHAEINYEKGNWMLKNLVEDKPIFVNSEILESPKHLNKYDKIKIGSKTIYWSNYLYEGESQELYLKDITSLNGRMSRSNFRVLSLFSIGMTICVFFLPGLLVNFWEKIKRRVYENIEFDIVNSVQEIMPIVYLIGFSTIGFILLLSAIKRMRDTGKPIWKLWIPIYNLKILYFEQSEK